MSTFPQIGERLRAYRIGSGLTVEDIAARLGISRAALYRYEAGDVVKLDTIDRLGRLFGVSMTALLGVGIEYFSQGLAFFERLRQLEEKASHMTIVFGPAAYVLTSDEYDEALKMALTEAQDESDRLSAQESTILIDVLKSRKAAYRSRQPSLVNIVSVYEIERFLANGLSLRNSSSRTQIAARRAMAAREVEQITQFIVRPPMGVQIGLTRRPLPTTGFQLIWQEDRSLVVTSPFRIGEQPNVRYGIATISDARDAFDVHQKLADQLWSSVLLGNAATDELRRLIKAAAF
jgi:transcriptional regulator with XRE-family HTH domain